MRSELLALAGSLVARGEPFALATVVRRQPASSAQAGDGALITADGTFHGWLGGSCTQPTVVREARKAIADGAPRLIALAPDPQAEKRPGILVFPMTCHSGGSVEIYIEPVLPPSRLLIFGVSPVAQALARLGRAMGFAIDVADPAADPAAFPDAGRLWTDPDAPPPPVAGGRPFAVVATMGERDEAAVRAALAAGPAYVGVVASRKRFAEIASALTAAGVPSQALASIRSPAGLDIGARAPEEIAVSILAEIVRVRRTEATTAEVGQSAEPARTPSGLPVMTVAEERDPVCGMAVPVAGARHTAEFSGRTLYFCCGGCREKFLASPGRYTPAAGAGA